MLKPRRDPASPEDVLRRSATLGGLPPNTLQELAAHLEKVEVPSGTVVLREGEQGDRYYLIDQGQIEVWVSRGSATRTQRETEDSAPWTPNPRRDSLLARLGPREGFGEIALLLGGDRIATVRAAADTILYALEGELFREVVNRHHGVAATLEEKMAFEAIVASLGKSSPFAGLPPQALRWLARRVEPVRFAPGEDIVREGERSDDFYLVRSGRVAVLARRADGTEHQLAILGPGEPFGEQALLTGGPRSATVRTLEPLEALRLGRSDFEEVLAQFRERRGYFVRLFLRRQRPNRAEQVELTRRSDEQGRRHYLLRDTQSQRCVTLSEQGAFLWELMNGERTVVELAMAHYARYRVLEPDTVLQLVAQLHEAGFVRIQSLAMLKKGNAKAGG